MYTIVTQAYENTLLKQRVRCVNVDRSSYLDLQMVHDLQVVHAAEENGENPPICDNRAEKYREHR